MQFKECLRDFFQNSFRKSHLISFVFLILIFPAIVFAADDVQQTDFQGIREMLKQAEKLSRKGEFAEAEKILRRAVASYPQDKNAKLNLAYMLLKQKQPVAGYELAYEVAKSDPKNSFAFAILGTAYLSAGNFPEAKVLLINAIKLNKKEALAWAGIGMLDFYENRVAVGLENLREAVYYDSREPDFLFALAQVAARAEKYREAAAAYEMFLQVSPRADKERRDRIKGLIRFLNFLGSRQSLYDVGGQPNTSVPVELVNDRPVIELKINGKTKPLKFVLDTGSGISVISQETAKELNIGSVARGGLARAIGGTGKFEIVYGFLKKVEIGDVKIANVPVYIRQFHNKNEDIDGYIGLSLISKFLTTIDYGNLTFALTQKDSLSKQKTENAVVTLPLRLTSSGFLSGEVQLEGVKNLLNFIVDTGASISVISYDVAGMEEIRGFVREEKMSVFGAAGVTEDVSSFLLPRVTFGNHSREQIKAIALDLGLINEASGFEQAGILGGNFLKNYSVTFDFQNSRVMFIPVSGK
ncbi:MAG: aspartyl protease family protein [Pyrinomonadaceae bacterium]